MMPVDMAAALRRLGFEVIDGVELDKVAMEHKLRDFARALAGSDVGLLFYAGHGLQVSGQNYLVPIDADLEDPSALDFELLSLDLVQRTMDQARTKILFLDACRDNPLARKLARSMGTRSGNIGHGLAQVNATGGWLISFSTEPGNVALDGKGRNSPFSGALVRNIGVPGVDLNAALIKVRREVTQETQERQVLGSIPRLLKPSISTSPLMSLRRKPLRRRARPNVHGSSSRTPPTRRSLKPTSSAMRARSLPPWHRRASTSSRSRRPRLLHRHLRRSLGNGPMVRSRHRKIRQPG
jgi:hypothetical protein